MIIFLYGPDTYRSRQRLRTLKQAFIKKHDPQGINVVVLDGATLTLERFNAAIKSLGLLSSKRFVVVDGLLGNGRKSAVAKALAEYLEEQPVPEDTIVVFWEGDVSGKAYDRKKRKKEPRSTQPLLEFLTAQKHAEYFEHLPPAQLKRWALNRFREQGASASPDVTETLISLVGNDLWQLQNEVDKLAAYRQGMDVGADDVKAFVAGQFDESIFSLTDAIAEKNQGSALGLLQSFLNRGEPPLYLLTMLVRQFRILLAVSAVAKDEPNHLTVARRLGLHPFVAQKALRQIRYFDRRQLVALFDQLVGIDRRLKTTREDPALLFDQFVIAATS